jgi:Ca2+-binding EF-hand superfamily protein
LDEIKVHYKGVPTDTLISMVSKYDLNHDGLIQPDEFIEALTYLNTAGYTKPSA